MSVNTTMAIASSVYHGPDSSNYAPVGSVDLNELVQVHAMEMGWFYIEYTTSTNNKRGYVPYDSINDAAVVANSVPTRSFTGCADVPTQNTTVYMGPGTSFATSGSVSSGEGITKFDETSENYTYIEYSTPNGTKRGYILTNRLENRDRGVLAVVSAPTTTIYAGPNTSYFNSGSVFHNEYVVIFERDISTSNPVEFYYVEYNSNPGRKRGYIEQNCLTACSSLANIGSLSTVECLSVAQQNLSVYSGPNIAFASVGSIFENEIVYVIAGVLAESTYAHIEYNTSSGKKRGYVIANALQSTSIPVAAMAIASSVYHGPDSSNYAPVGSVDLNELVQVHAMEMGWFYIEYTTSTNNKRGYVPYDSINDAAVVANSVPTRSFTGCADVPTQNTTVYMGPGTSFATSGSVSSGEGITKFDETSENYTYIEYSTPNGTKRGYILTNRLENRNLGVLANVIDFSAPVYAGPDSIYHRCGSVFENEYVVIFERDISSIYPQKWFFIEYNSISGRKRGYVNQNLITARSSLSSINELKTGIEMAISQQNLPVYYGPNPSFALVGSIFENERVSLLGSNPAESAYKHIEYYTKLGTKRGYVDASFLQDTSISMPTISLENVTKGEYGTSGNNRPLEYYKIGNGNNVLAVVFAVHGYEDAWAADGEELMKIGKYLIEEISQDNIPDWTVYVIPSANPDGLLDGWTNNGPGRTTVGTATDMNRSFPANFNAYYDTRNYTGSSSLASPETVALKEKLLDWKTNADTMILLDVHGWLNQTIGDDDVGEYYCNEFGFSNSSLEMSSGYLTRWGQTNGMLVSLIELPFPSSPQDIVVRNFKGKFVQATRNLLNNVLSGSSIFVTGVSVSPKSVALNFGGTQELTAIVLPVDATNKAITWQSSNLNIATVNSNGKVIAGTAAGTATITVTTADGNFTDSTSIIVTANYTSVTDVSISPVTTTLNYGGVQQLTAIVLPSDATNKAVTWSSNNINIAAVNENGLVTAGTTVGTATITATTSDGHIAAYANILVKATGLDDYTTYTKYNIVTTAVYNNWLVEQGFNDKTSTSFRGHLGYDLTSNRQSTNIKPIFDGDIVYATNLNPGLNGNIVVIEHTVNGVTFYSSYSHLASNSTALNNIVNQLKTENRISVSTETVIGKMGGTGGPNDSFSPHLHLAVYTKATYLTSPYGYASGDKATEFEDIVIGEDFEGNPLYYNYNGYYYNGPRSGGAVFYDPWGVISTNGQVIVEHHPV